MVKDYLSGTSFHTNSTDGTGNYRKLNLWKKERMEHLMNVPVI